MAIVRNPGCRLMIDLSGRLRSAMLQLATPGGVTHVEVQCDEDHAIRISACAQPSGQLRPEPNCWAMRSPIIRCFAAAEDQWRHIGAERGDEHQQQPAMIPGRDQRNDHPPQDVPRVA